MYDAFYAPDARLESICEEHLPQIARAYYTEITHQEAPAEPFNSGRVNLPSMNRERQEQPVDESETILLDDFFSFLEKSSEAEERAKSRRAQITACREHEALALMAQTKRKRQLARLYAEHSLIAG